MESEMFQKKQGQKGVNLRHFAVVLLGTGSADDSMPALLRGSMFLRLEPCALPAQPAL